MIAGIDPGVKGALALIDENDASRVPLVFDLPYIGDIPDVRWLSAEVGIDWCDSDGPIPLCLFVVEQPIAMPGQSSKATASTFRAYGALLAWVTLARIPLITPRPNAWKAKLGVTRDKESSLALAARLFPGAGLHGPRGGAKDGRAEALLLAEYGRRHHVGVFRATSGSTRAHSVPL